MRKSFLAAFLILFAAASAWAFSPQDLDAALAESLAMWEHVVPWTRLGRAPATAPYDSAAMVRRLAADFSAAGRYKEFEYLFLYLQKQIGAKRLELRVIADRPPTPGFWPARISETRRAIVISETDLAALEKDDQLLRSSFVRAIATLYYADDSPPLNAAWRMRNVLSEYSAFMTGIWVESIYLLEILKVQAPRDPAPDWYHILLGSAGSDNLAGASAQLFLVDMEWSYSVVNGLRSIQGQKDALAFATRIKAIPEDLVEAVRRGTYGPSPTPLMLSRGTLARSVVMMTPWAILSLSRAGYASDRATAKAIDECLAGLDEFSSTYRYFDPVVAAERQVSANAWAFRPVEAGAPSPASPYPPNPADAPAPLPGAASETWYRWCEKSDPFAFEGLMEIPAAEAAGIAAYRISRDAGGAVIGIEYFLKGKPRSSGALMYAFRISVEREAGAEIWRWENPYGALTSNESGYAMMKVDREGNDAVMTFYSRDGRRVQDESGAWSVARRALDGGGYELRFMDGAGKLWAGAYGYAVDRRVPIEAGAGVFAQERTLYAADGSPAASRSAGPHRTIRASLADGDGVVRTYEYFGIDGEPVLYLGDHARDRETRSAERYLMESFDAEGNPSTGPLGFCMEEGLFVDGLLVSSRTYGPDGEPAVCAIGYHGRLVAYDENGGMVEARYVGPADEPALGETGIFLRISAFEGRGTLNEVWFYGPDGEAMADESGAAHIRWYIGPDGESAGADAWDTNGALLTGTAQGEI